DLERGTLGRERRADLKHVRPEDLLRAGRELVGVVLHEGGPTGQAVAHDLGRADEDGRLPVTLGAEAVPVCHESLDRETRELAQTAEVLEVRRERREAALGEEAAQGELLPRAVAQRLPALAVGA